MTATLNIPPQTRTNRASAANGVNPAARSHSARCPRQLRRCTAPHHRGSLGVRWYQKDSRQATPESEIACGLGELMTGGVARPQGASRRRLLVSRVALGALATIAVACGAAGAARLGFIPNTSATSVALASLVILACVSMALVACFAEIERNPSGLDRAALSDQMLDDAPDISSDELSDEASDQASDQASDHESDETPSESAACAGSDVGCRCSV